MGLGGVLGRYRARNDETRKRYETTVISVNFPLKLSKMKASPRGFRRDMIWALSLQIGAIILNVHLRDTLGAMCKERTKY